MGRGAESTKGRQEPISKAGRFGGEGLLKALNGSWRVGLAHTASAVGGEPGKRSHTKNAS